MTTLILPPPPFDIDDPERVWTAEDHQAVHAWRRSVKDERVAAEYHRAVADRTYPVSQSTGHYTLDQIEGEACVQCGYPFHRGQTWVYLMPGLPDAQLARHAACPTGGAR